MPVVLRASSKCFLRFLMNVSGPPRYTTLPSIFLPWASPAIVWLTTATRIEAAISSVRAPWFIKGWMSDFANTPHLDAIVYISVDLSARRSMSFIEIPSSVAIWSMNAPVPPAQEPFILTSSLFFKKRILASSPPSSMTASVFGM